LRPPHVIALDNYHHLADDSPFHDMLQDALTVIPEGITVIINSRSAPPPSLALLNTYKKIHAIGWHELKFTLNETRSLMKTERKTRPPGETVEQLHRVTEGWAAGLTLLRERIGRLTSTSHELDWLKPDEFFDYFATELFQKADEGTQSVLLKTAFLPHVSSNTAAELTGNMQAGTLLAALSRNHFFTEQRPGRDPIYQYHPLFRAFLQARARQIYAGSEIRALLCQAATLLEAAGQIEDAVELYQTSEAWDALVRIILSNAQTMMSQGRHRLIDTWLSSLPAFMLEQDPWLLYWKGICRMPLALQEARELFEKAFSLFRKRHDASGVFLAWSGVVESFIQELDVSQMDPWIALLDDLMNEYPAFPSPQIEGHVTTRIFIALSMRQPWHPAFEGWRDKAIALLDSKADPTLRMLCGFYLIIHLLVVGDAALCERVMSTMRVIISSSKRISPLAYITGKFADGWMAWTTSSYDRSLKTMVEGLQMSRDSGVHLWDYLLLGNGLFAALMTGDLRRSKELLGQMAYALEHGRPLDKFYYYWFASWHSMLSNDVQGALALASASIALVTKLGILGGEARGRLAQAHYMHMTGNYSEAKEHISKSHAIGQKMKSSIIVFCCDLEASAIAFTEGDEEAGLQFLSDAMSLGREKGYAAFNFSFLQKEELSYLCVKALEAGIEPDFVIEMIRKRKLVPETRPLHVENWPWVLKIHTLGHFGLIKDGNPLTFEGKVQKRPLYMLKAIIAFGGKEVSDEQLIDTLWPEADGDVANLSFRTTLHRLRQLIGKEGAIELKEGRVTLAPQYCWVDAWAFQRLTEKAESLLKENGCNREMRTDNNAITQLIQASEKAVSMYGGEFLPGDRKHSWTISLREKLKSKFIRLVGRVGNYYERTEQWEHVIELYQKALEVDDLQEEFYRRLILAYHKIGRHTEARAMYDRCRNILSSVLGIEPSPGTEAVRKNMRAGK
jgi:LuxR family transcriptional regulator, maltose regulon positive regulatory protein